jgi:murein DD-endopeptidase MepM/ murein hydrolase activator NlpD
MKKHSAKFLVLAALSMGLAACAPEFNPPPEYKGGFLWESDKSKTVTVEPGDTIYTIARRYDVPTKVIIARNGLQPPYTLTPGQQLILDPTRTHTVVRGDTLSQLAVTYSVEMRLLASANDLYPPYTIRVGQELWIPDPFTQAAAPAGQRADGPAVAMIPPRAPRSAISTEPLTPPAPLSAPVSPQPLPPGSPQQAPDPQPAIPPPPIAPPEPAAPPPVVEPPAAAPEPEIVAPPQPLTEPPARASARFAWPVRGKLIAGFGSAGKGLHNDGINIAAPTGAQVHAADNGVVAYAGNELKGFGNLLLIKHADGWTTAYAHNEKLLVGRGAEVKQGQVIATVGRTGNVDSPQLHFEVRKGTQAMDPLEFLAKQ